MNSGIERIPLFSASLGERAVKSAERVAKTSQLAAGPHVGQFEDAFGRFIGNPHLVSVGEMSSAIQISLYMAGVRPNDEVIASPMACLATTMPVLNLFAKVRWCDVDPLTGNMDPTDLRRKISSRTKAILIFHWAGNVAPLSEIYEIARANGVSTVEDASEALGARYGGSRIGGTGGDYVVFSFYPNRHLTTIEGAAIAFASAEQYARARRLRRYGINAATFRCEDGEINPDSDIIEAGWNSYLNNVSAAIGLSKIPEVAARIEKFRDNGEFYDRRLAMVNEITLLQRPLASQSAHWVYSFLANRRDDLLRHLTEAGVHASKVHLRNDLYSCFGDGKKRLAGVDAFSRQCISIPCGDWVTTGQRERIVEVLEMGW